MFAFSANEAIHVLESASASAFGLIFPGETPSKSRAQTVLRLRSGCNGPEGLRGYAPSQTILRGAFAHFKKSRRRSNPPIADTTTGPGAARAALRTQVVHKKR
eukprot:6205248-Pleurochrysis_carterae.AAC.1